METTFSSQLYNTRLTQETRAVHVPVLVGMGILSLLRAGLRVGGTGTSVYLYYQLSLELHQQIEHLTNSVHALQNQINTLAAVSLQNHWVLDVLTAEKMCAMLGEESCNSVNESVIVMGKVKKVSTTTWIKSTNS